MKRSSIVVLVSLTVLAGCGKQASILPKDDAERIQGTWVIVKLEDAGKEIDKMKDGRLMLGNGKASMREPERQGKEPGKEVQGTYHIDATKNPKEIDLIMMLGGNEERLTGIYQFDGDTLLICAAEDKQKKRPTEFTTAGTENTLFTLTREKK